MTALWTHLTVNPRNKLPQLPTRVSQSTTRYLNNLPRKLNFSASLPINLQHRTASRSQKYKTNSQIILIWKEWIKRWTTNTCLQCKTSTSTILKVILTCISSNLRITTTPIIDRLSLWRRLRVPLPTYRLSSKTTTFSIPQKMLQWRLWRSLSK